MAVGVVFLAMTSRPLEQYYTAAATSFIAFARKIDDEDWSRPVPCAPQWTVRDVLSHVAGVPDDALQGRLVGVGTSAWSASQVERHADSTIDELLARWEEQIEPFATLVVETGSANATLDCHCHEHDIRHALDLHGSRDSDIVKAAGEAFVSGIDVPFPIGVEMDRLVVTNGHPDLGRAPHEEVVLRNSSHFEVFRSRLGRRSFGQVEDYEWRGPTARIAQVLEVWFMFEPNAIAIHE